MFSPAVYSERRTRLAAGLPSGLALFLGNGLSPMNYRDNEYAFRQDSSFYYWGLDRPDLAAVLDVDDRREIIFGDEFTMDDIIWRGPQPTIAAQAGMAGVRETLARSALTDLITDAQRRGRRIHFLPQYRAENNLALQGLTGVPAGRVNDEASADFIRTVVAQRSVKSPEEIDQHSRAVEICHDMHVLAMRTARPGMMEAEVAGALEGLAVSKGGRIAFPVIFTVHGETLHNHSHDNRLEAGHVVVNDSGAESPMHYAGDITRAIPIGGRLTGVRRDLYQAVLRAQLGALNAIRPGVPYKQVHLLAARSLAEDLSALGCLRGDVDAAIDAGAHALFFPHGLGHMIGLDVHDMEALGEDYVGYDDTVQRSAQFGLRSLRFARAPQPGFVLTVEPGLYFIPALIDRWRAEKRLADFIDYDRVEKLKDAGGIRIEDNVVVTDTGCRVLGPPIPKELTEVEALASA